MFPERYPPGRSLLAALTFFRANMLKFVSVFFSFTRQSGSSDANIPANLMSSFHAQEKLDEFTHFLDRRQKLLQALRFSNHNAQLDTRFEMVVIS